MLPLTSSILSLCFKGLDTHIYETPRIKTNCELPDHLKRRCNNRYALMELGSVRCEELNCCTLLESWTCLNVCATELVSILINIWSGNVQRCANYCKPLSMLLLKYFCMCLFVTGLGTQKYETSEINMHYELLDYLKRRLM